MRKTQVSAFLAVMAAAAIAVPSAYADDALVLTFNRTGADASTVSVTTSGVSGVQASLLSVSHSMKTGVAASVLCPDVNGNTSPTITYVMQVTGLPGTFTYNTVGLDIHAMNASGAYQQANDNKSRQWNVTVENGAAQTSLTPFATRSDFDIAANVNTGSDDRHQVWDFTSAQAVAATNPLVLKLTVTAGSANEGCFFGLSSVSLSMGEGEVTPPEPPVTPVEPGDGKCYVIKWKNNTSSYMAEMGDGGIEIVNYSVSSKIFWELVPTDNEDCYYVRNMASGNYIGSCNMTPSSASKVKMSATPVEYYIHRSAATSGENSGCSWMSSTDCAGYNTESSGARCLNKDGASSSIITWTTGTGNVGSYWTLTESENLYELRPFTPTAAIGSAKSFYQILSPENLALTHSLDWSTPAHSAEYRWYFVGESNVSGGYQIVDGVNHTALNSGAKYTVGQAASGNYTFTNSATKEQLSISGVNEFAFGQMRTPTSLRLQLYSIPCGATSSVWATQVESGSFHYPLATRSGNQITYPAGAKSKYEVVSRDAIELVEGCADVTITLNAAPAENVSAALYFDWDCDGIFEEMQTLTPAQQMKARIEGKIAGERTRMRLRLTTNGQMGADAEVAGQVIDFLLVEVPVGEEQFPILTVNDKHRGFADIYPDRMQAVATPGGTAAFVCWKEGHALISTAPEMDVERTTTPPTYMAVFSPNLDEEDPEHPNPPMSGLINVEAAGVSVSCGADKVVRVSTELPVKVVYVFSTAGDVVAKASGVTSLAVGHLPSGVYVVKAVTPAGAGTAKIAL